MARLSNALIADIAAIIVSFHSHNQINNIFTRSGTPGEPPSGSKIVKTETWLRLANEDPDCDEIALLGRLLEELMDRDFPGANREKIEGIRADVVRALGRAGLSYRRGGAILGATLSTPSRSVEHLIRQRNLGELQKEFDRALANVETDPPAAITAACAILEALFDVGCRIDLIPENRATDRGLLRAGAWADVAVFDQTRLADPRPTRTRTATPSASPPSWSTARSSSTAPTTLVRFPGVCSGEGRALLHLFTALAKRHRTEPLQQLNNRAIADRRPRRTNSR